VIHVAQCVVQCHTKVDRLWVVWVHGLHYEGGTRLKLSLRSVKLYRRLYIIAKYHMFKLACCKLTNECTNILTISQYWHGVFISVKHVLTRCHMWVDILATCYQHVIHMLPTCFCPNSPNIQVIFTCGNKHVSTGVFWQKHVDNMLQTCYEHAVRIRPQVSQICNMLCSRRHVVLLVTTLGLTPFIG